MGKFFLAGFVLLFLLPLVGFAEEPQSNTEKQEAVIYNLIQDNLKPDTDEFYLSSIYGSKENPKALIKRSNNVRSGDLFNSAVEYGIGDKISENYEITGIDFIQREVLIKNLITNDLYSLQLTYGDAKSRLSKKN